MYYLNTNERTAEEALSTDHSARVLITGARATVVVFALGLDAQHSAGWVAHTQGPKGFQWGPYREVTTVLEVAERLAHTGSPYEYRST
jgi:hypothetical protein